MTTRRALPLLATLVATSSAARGEDPSPSPDPPGVVRLHIEANTPEIHVRRRDPIRHIDEDLCTLPCDKVLDGRDGRLFQFADGGASADPFTLRGRRGDVTAEVRVHPAMRTGGGLLIGFGAAATVAGSLAILLGVTTQSRNTEFVTEAASVPSAVVGGGVALGAGLLTMAAGITTVVLGKTTYQLRPSVPSDALPPREPVLAAIPKVAAPTAGAEGETPSPDAPGVVRLHIESNVADVAVHRIGRVEEEVCKMPCDRVIDGRDGRPLHFVGQASSATPLTLTGLHGDVTVRVTAHPGMRPGGVALMAIGGAGIAAAFAMLLAGSSFSRKTVGVAEESSQRHPLLLPVGVAATLGTLSLSSGAVTFVLGKAGREIVP
jgi:hypothetical protein